MHAYTGRVGYQYIGAAVCAYETVIQDILHVSRKELCIGDIVQSGIDLGIFDGFGDVFNTNNFTALTGNEVGYRTRSCIEVIHQFIAFQITKRTDGTVEAVGLFIVRLVKTLGTDLEFQVFHQFINKSRSFVDVDIQITDGVIAFQVVHPQDGCQLGIVFRQIFQEVFSLAHFSVVLDVELHDEHGFT